MIDENDNIVIIDPGMSLRVPYSDPSNFGCVSDVSAGTSRRLMKNQGQGGKLMYAAPEIIEKDDVFDGFAIDLWAVGVVLFVMLIGFAPFKWAHPSDKRYAQIAKGRLKELLTSLEIPISEEACDLLQGMFWRDPRRRFTLAEVMDHPWVLGEKPKEKASPEPLSPKNVSNEMPRKRNSSKSKPQPGCETQERVNHGQSLGTAQMVGNH